MAQYPLKALPFTKVWRSPNLTAWLCGSLLHRFFILSMRPSGPPERFHVGKRYRCRPLHLAPKAKPPQLKGEPQGAEWLELRVSYPHPGATASAGLEVIDTEPGMAVPRRQAPSRSAQHLGLERRELSVQLANIVNGVAFAIPPLLGEPKPRSDGRHEGSRGRARVLNFEDEPSDLLLRLVLHDADLQHRSARKPGKKPEPQSTYRSISDVSVLSLTDAFPRYDGPDCV
jgi:hypothetical protein